MPKLFWLLVTLLLLQYYSINILHCKNSSFSDWEWGWAEPWAEKNIDKLFWLNWPETVQSIPSLVETGLVRDPTPSGEESLLQDLSPAVLGEGGGRVESSTVRDTSHVYVGVHLVELISQVVTVELSPSCSSRGPDHHNLFCKKNNSSVCYVYGLWFRTHDVTS